MALPKRLFSAARPYPPSPIHAPVIPAARSHFHRELFTSPAAAGFFRRFLQRRGISNALPSFLTFPSGEKLRAQLKSIGVPGDRRLRLDGLRPPAAAAEEVLRVGVADAKRVMRVVQMEQIRDKLRSIPESTIPYGEFVRICVGVCVNGETGLEFAKALDESGNVFVLGAVVFLHPEQVAKSMERLITQSITMPCDPRRKELDNLGKQKALIDGKARSMVRKEVYFGLGFMVLQTLGFMRLTFWELSWDVMEPICFFVTSLHFALAYAFFLRTSKEPSFVGYFQRRFKAKQKKLMKLYNFDLVRYDRLCEAFYPNYRKPFVAKYRLEREREMVFDSVHG